MSKVYWRSREGDDEVMFDDDEAMDSDDSASGPSPSPKQQPRLRVEFPETWLWSDANTGYHLIAGVIYASSEFNSRSTCHRPNYSFENLYNLQLYSFFSLNICPAFMNGCVPAECSVV